MNKCTKHTNRKELWLKVLVDSGYIHTEIDKQLVKEEQIKMELLNRSFEVLMQIELRMKK